MTFNQRAPNAFRRSQGSLSPTICLLALVLACGSQHERRSEPGGRIAAVNDNSLSVVLITLDTIRADKLEPYGGSVPTPTLQQLALDGIVLEKAYATTPVTLPSHASILTGLEPPEHGVRNNGSHILDRSSETLAEILGASGFRTAAFVSAAVLDKRFGLDQGFEIYDDDLSSGTAKAPGAVAERPATHTIEKALSWLDQLSPDDRFFLWVHLFDPHAPYAPPPEFEREFDGQPYDGEIAYVDGEIGRLLDHPRLDTSDDAVVTVIGDHGESLGEHGEATHGMLAYDSTLRIPWIVRSPNLPGGRRVRESVSQIDLLPTLLDVLGVDSPTGLAGVSLEPTLATPGAPGRAGRALYAETLVPLETYGWASLHTVRMEDWKLIEAPRPELYNLSVDPQETSNLYPGDPERLSGLRSELKRRLSSRNEPDRPPRQLDEQTASRLRSLGYLSSQGSLVSREKRPDPKDVIEVHDLVQLAEQHLSRLNLETAEESFRAALLRDPANLAATTGLAKTLAERGVLDEALVVGQSAVSLAPGDADQLVVLALIQAAAGPTEEALETLEQALALAPRSLDATIAKALCLARLGRQEEAADALRGIVATASGYPRFDIRFAEFVDLPVGNLAAAERRVRQALELEPFLIDGWRVLGQVLTSAGKTDEAIAASRQALSMHPDHPGLQQDLGLLLVTTGDLDTAAPLLEQALSRVPTGPAYDGLAAIANRKGNWPQGESFARQAIEAAPILGSAWNNLAIALEEQGKLRAASAAYREAWSRDPSFWQAHFNHGLLLRKQGLFAEARQAFTDVLRRQPHHAGSNYELGLLYAGPLADAPAASRHLKAAIDADPMHPRVTQIRRLLVSLAEYQEQQNK